MNTSFINVFVVALFGAWLSNANATLIMACQGSSSSCGAICGTLGGSQSILAGGANGDTWLCNALAPQPRNLNPIVALKPMTDALPATTNVPRCTSVRRDLVNKPGLPAVAINKASQSDLIQVPGISASTAQKIIAERAKREFSDWDDVLRRVDSTRCIDFTGSPLQVMTRPFNPRGTNPKSPGF